MITAVDTNVLLDILTGSVGFADASMVSLLEAGRAGALVVSEIVYSELAAAFGGDGGRLDSFLADAGIRLLPSTAKAWLLAGATWRSYRKAGGSRRRILPDFLIASHAVAHADRLLTRDRGFYRKHFSQLEVVEP